jgi:hypothetical protein
MTPTHTQTEQFDLALEEVLSRVVELLNDYRNVKKVVKEGSVVKALYRTSVASMGEVVTVTATRVAPSATELAIASTSTWPITLMDWGKNRRNVERLVKNLRGA